MVAVANARTGAIRLVARNEILYAQAHGDFVRIVTGEGRYLLRARLAVIEERWEQFGFVRVHRQYVANLGQALELRPQLGGTAELAFPGGQAIPIARRQVAELRRALGV
jgi:DNA-binding LytR/AlgR family response regulator